MSGRKNIHETTQVDYRYVLLLPGDEPFSKAFKTMDGVPELAG